MGDNRECHVSMLQPAIFTALPAIDAGRLAASHVTFGRAGHEIGFAGQVRLPTTIDAP
jgi:hypothetical protein